jgi:hypothetical protein
MSRLRKFTIIIFLLSLVLLAKGSTLVSPTQKFDEFGDINCEDEWAHLDNFAIQLQHETSAKGVIIFYGGRLFRGRLPKRGEAATRAGRMKPYLVNLRGIPAERVMVINGGYSDAWKAELWIVPPGASMPTPNATVPANRVRFRKGRPNPRDFSCERLG